MKKATGMRKNAMWSFWSIYPDGKAYNRAGLKGRMAAA